jgi:hypothetical protein
VFDGVEGDVDDVVIGDRIGDLATTAPTGEDTGLAEDPEVLGDQRLAGVEGFGEVVDAALAMLDLEHDRQPEGVSERLEQLGSSLDA